MEDGMVFFSLAIPFLWGFEGLVIHHGPVKDAANNLNGLK
jgi:hypothetical protein